MGTASLFWCRWRDVELFRFSDFILLPFLRRKRLKMLRIFGSPPSVRNRNREAVPVGYRLSVLVPVAGVEPAPCRQDWILRSLRVWEDRRKQCFTRSVKAPESPDNKRIFARSSDSLIRFACYYGKIEKIPVSERL